MSDFVQLFLLLASCWPGNISGIQSYSTRAAGRVFDKKVVGAEIHNVTIAVVRRRVLFHHVIAGGIEQFNALISIAVGNIARPNDISAEEIANGRRPQLNAGIIDAVVADIIFELIPITIIHQLDPLAILAAVVAADLVVVTVIEHNPRVIVFSAVIPVNRIAMILIQLDAIDTPGTRIAFDQAVGAALQKDSFGGFYYGIMMDLRAGNCLDVDAIINNIGQIDFKMIDLNVIGIDNKPACDRDRAFGGNANAGHIHTNVFQVRARLHFDFRARRGIVDRRLNGGEIIGNSNFARGGQEMRGSFGFGIVPSLTCSEQLVNFRVHSFFLRLLSDVISFF